MSYYYAVGPVSLSPDPDDPTVSHYHAPSGTVGWIDTRPVIGRGFESGFFAFHEYPEHLKDTHTIIGDGNRLDECYPIALERSAWETLYGVKTNATDSLFDMLWRLFFVDADPEGIERCKPGTPTHNRNLELYLGGHSLLHREKFTGKNHPSWPALQKLQQVSFAKLVQEQHTLADRIRTEEIPFKPIEKDPKDPKNPKPSPTISPEVREFLAKKAEEIPCKVLTDLCLLYKCDPNDILTKGLDIERMKRTSVMRDDFQRSDNAIYNSGNATYDGTDQGWDWATLETPGYTTDRIHIVSNKCEVGYKDSAVRQYAYQTTPGGFSSSNYYQELVVEQTPIETSSAHAEITMFARHSGNSAVTGYSGRFRTLDGSDTKFTDRYISVVVDTTGTIINSTTTDQTRSDPSTVKMTVDGSTISTQANASTEFSVSDSTLESGVYGGFGVYIFGNYRATSYYGEDLLVASSFIPSFFSGVMN